MAYRPSHARSFARQFLSAEGGRRRMAVVVAYAQSRAPADCSQGCVLVEWDGAQCRPLMEAVHGLETWGNVYGVPAAVAEQ